MADTNHAGPMRTEGDGVSYRSLGWSMVVLTVVTLFCYGFVVGLFKFMESRAIAGDTPRAPLAAAPAQPAIESGRVVGGPAAVPSLLVDEPMNLQKFQAEEERQLTSYGWVDQNAGLVRLPIERAKALLLERGLPARAAAPVSSVMHEEPKAPGQGEAAKPAAPKPGAHK